jgi:2-dehydro-3-deoxyglucarate aldolase/4-hydroxy-2-oxoheptanedioate aldolase
VDLPVNRFKRMLAERRTTYGAWLMSAHPTITEAMGCAGFDFLVVDMEHTPVDTPQLVDHLRALDAAGCGGIVRLPWNDMVMVKRALDAGAQALMMPFVQTAEEARRAVSFTRYPPQGVRGVAGSQRASRFATVPDYLKQANDALCVVVQIETVDALSRLPEIAAVPGIDAIFIGPSDLAASMGLLGDIGNPAVQAKLEEGAKLCRAAGKPCGIIGGTPEMVARFAGYGYDWIAIGSDMSFMVTRAQEMLARVRGGTAAGTKSGF